MIEAYQALGSGKGDIAARRIAANTPLITIHGETQEAFEENLEDFLDDFADAIEDLKD